MEKRFVLPASPDRALLAPPLNAAAMTQPHLDRFHSKPRA